MQQKEESAVNMLMSHVDALKEIRWTYGPMTCYSLNLEGIEFPYDKKKYTLRKVDDKVKMHSVIEWLCKSDSEKAITIPTLKKLITTKWNRICQGSFMKQFYLHLVGTILTTLIGCLHNFKFTLIPHSSGELAVTIIYPANLALYLYMAYMDLPHLVQYRLDYWGGSNRGAALWEKYLKTAIFVSFLFLCIFKLISSVSSPVGALEGDEEMLYLIITSTCLSVCLLASWLLQFYFFLGFERTGPFVLTIIRVINFDFPFFLVFYIPILIAFSCPLAIMGNNEDLAIVDGFKNLFFSIWSLLQWTVILERSYDILEYHKIPQHFYWLFDIILTLFHLITYLMMCNLLIAMVNSTYHVYSSAKLGLVLIEKYNIMACLERNTWEKDRHNLISLYAITILPDDVAMGCSYEFEYQEIDDVWWKSSVTTSKRLGIFISLLKLSFI
jgi:hypothetical protein